jgi:CRISPR/Cas system CSM-associated protein Csm3 (group 7 of RAMP superfamily)
VVLPHTLGRSVHHDLLNNFRPLSQLNEYLVDRLFGTRYQGECLFVEDAVPIDGRPIRRWLHSRTSIDRVTGTARDRTLFVTEVVPAGGPELHSRLRARHPVGTLTQDGDGFPFEYSLLLAGLLSLDMLGGDKSTGLGKCRITITGNTVRWNDKRKFPVEETLKSFADLGEDWYAFLKDFRGEAP